MVSKCIITIRKYFEKKFTWYYVNSQWLKRMTNFYRNFNRYKRHYNTIKLRIFSATTHHFSHSHYNYLYIVIYTYWPSLPLADCWWIQKKLDLITIKQWVICFCTGDSNIKNKRINFFFNDFLKIFFFSTTVIDFIFFKRFKYIFERF